MAEEKIHSYYVNTKTKKECNEEEALEFALKGILEDKSEFKDFEKHFGYIVTEWFFSGYGWEKRSELDE